MHHPKVSIVCAYYNRENHVEESVQSLLDQTYDNFEVIIVNDGSTDATLENLSAFNDARLRIIDQKNTGFTLAIIRAIEESNGEYIAVHGSGDLSDKNRITMQSNILSEKSNVGLVGCFVEDDNNTGDGVYTLRIPNGLPFTETLLKQNIFEHGATMFRRSIYDKVGGYRPFFTYGQDYDLWLRMSVYCDYHNVEEVLYRRYRLADGVSNNVQKLLLQNYLLNFSVYCANEKIKSGRDPLDSIGPLAIFLKTPSKHLSKKIMWIGMNEMIYSDVKQGWDVIKKSINEAFSLKIFIIFIIGLTHKNKLIWALIGLPIFKFIYLRHLKRSGQK